MSNSSSRSAISKKGGAHAAPAKTPKKTVSCPQCGASVVWDAANRFRPFCSERCKTIDLGAWANESYRIPVEDDRTDDSTGESDPTR